MATITVFFHSFFHLFLFDAGYNVGCARFESSEDIGEVGPAFGSVWTQEAKMPRMRTAESFWRPLQWSPSLGFRWRGFAVAARGGASMAIS